MIHRSINDQLRALIVIVIVAVFTNRDRQSIVHDQCTLLLRGSLLETWLFSFTKVKVLCYLLRIFDDFFFPSSIMKTGYLVFGCSFLLLMILQNDEKYHCSETGYRVPLKCVEINNETKEKPGKRSRRSLSFLSYGDKSSSLQRFHPSPRRLKWRRLFDTSSVSLDKQVSYMVYRSCLPAEAEEKLSVLGFEVRIPQKSFCLFHALLLVQTRNFMERVLQK